MVIMRTCIYINKISFVTFEKKFNTCKGNPWDKTGSSKIFHFINVQDHEKNSLFISPLKTQLIHIIYFNYLPCEITYIICGLIFSHKKKTIII